MCSARRKPSAMLHEARSHNRQSSKSCRCDTKVTASEQQHAADAEAKVNEQVDVQGVPGQGQGSSHSIESSLQAARRRVDGFSYHANCESGSSAQPTQRSFQRTSSVTVDPAWNEGDFTVDDHYSTDRPARGGLQP